MSQQATTAVRQWTSSDEEACVRLRTVEGGGLELEYEDTRIEGDGTLQHIAIDSPGSKYLRGVPGGYGEVYGRGAQQVCTIERVNPDTGTRTRLVIFLDPEDPRNESETIGWRVGGLLP